MPGSAWSHIKRGVNAGRTSLLGLSLSVVVVGSGLLMASGGPPNRASLPAAPASATSSGLGSRPAATGAVSLARTTRSAGGSGAGGLAAGWSATTHSLRVGSLTRSFLLVRPRAEAGARLPLVIVLHGRNLSPRHMAALSGFPSVAGDAILAYPAGFGASWNAGACCGPAQRAGVNDVAFVNAVIHELMTSQPDADPHAVFLVGYSNGGRMAYRLACADPGVFSGFAAVEAVPVDACSKLVPLPVEIVASTHDPLLTIPPGATPKVVQGFVEPTVDDVVTHWRALDGCRGAPAVHVTGLVTTQTWDHCDGQGRVQFTVYQGGSHAWPAGAGPTPSAERMIWSDFHPS